MLRRRYMLATMALLLGFGAVGLADQPSRLRLVPFPKRVDLQQGAFEVSANLVLEVPADRAGLLAGMIGAELNRAGLPIPQIQRLKENPDRLRLSTKPGGPMPELPRRKSPTDEDYALEVYPDRVICSGAGRSGLFYAVETLCQLIRANRRQPLHRSGARRLPCVTIRDWPSIRWRCFQDDMTRGPSSTLDTLKREVTLGAGLKMNLFTYYMEYQYAFKKHPLIGPKDGSLTPEDLRTLVGHARRRHVDV
ncbi:unnamed protein product, partial [marine sediment metagenome]